MKPQERIEPDPMPIKATEGRDELNLAEFPLCALAHRLSPGQKTLQFEDHVWDDHRADTITRRLTITGSDAYGLPTALDDEVLLGLIQVTKQRGFVDRRVPFTRYELIRLLSWREESKSYRRMEDSLNRWAGITLRYQNAWWNKAGQCWMNETFHVLDNVWLCHRADPDPVEPRDGQSRSAFVWNEVIFRSFRAGNLKGIDFEFFKGLKGAVAKRLYRFLDKRFFKRERLQFDLKAFACEHVGLSRVYDSAGLRRKLRPGIVELEEKGFLRPVPEAERFQRVCSGQWNVSFARATARSVQSAPAATPEPAHPAPLPAPPSPAQPLTTALTQRGVSGKSARATVRDYPPDRITAQLEVFDWLVAQKDPKVSRNPPGFLVSSIRGDYAPPREFVNQAEQARAQRELTQRKRQRESQQQELVAKRQALEQERAHAEQAFWQSLSAEEANLAEQRAIEEAPGFQRKLLAKGGSLAAATRHAVLDAYARRQLLPVR